MLNGFQFSIALSMLLVYAGICLAEQDEYHASDNQSHAKLKKLQQEVTLLKNQIKKNQRSGERLKSSFNDLQNKLKMQGFLSAGLSQSNRDLEYYNIGNDLTTLARGRMGLQFDFQINEQLKSVVQIFGRATSRDWDIGTEWAYLSYRSLSNTEVRLGRIRAPAFFYSETIEIGYSYPWVTPPWEPYGAVPFRNMDGGDFSYLWINGEWASKAKFFYGANSLKIGEGDSSEDQLDNEDIKGIEYFGSSTNWQLRFAHGQALTTFEQASGPLSGKGKFDYTSLAVSFDHEQWLISCEFAGYVAEDDKQVLGSDIFPDIQAGYILLGYRMGSYLPYFTYAHNRTADKDQRSLQFLRDLFNRTQSSYTLGLRKDLQPGLAVKAEVNYATHFEDSIGEFSWSFDATGYPKLPDFPDVLILNLAVDSTF